MTNENETMPDFNDPLKAREYIDGFSQRVMHGKEITYIKTGEREYHFDKLNDDEAVKVATMLYRDIEEPAHRNWSKQ